MKKLFIAAMALATIVSCSKDDQGPALDSGKKTVSITIANGNGTRTAVNGGAATVTPGANGEDGDTFSCETDADDLTIVFADKSGAIQKTLQLTDLTNAIPDENGTHTPTYTPEESNGTNNMYTWHNVPWNVTQIAVVRVDPKKDADKEFDNISDYADLAINEDANLTRTLDEIVLFGQAILEDTGTTHVVGDIFYHYWDATVEVAPKLARFEINSIQCEDLGDNNPHDGDGSYSFDKLTIGETYWTSVASSDNPARKYTMPAVNGVVLHGSYKNTNNIPNYVTADMEAPADTKNVWSWNVDPDLTEFDEMNVALEAFAYDYTPAQTSVPLKVTEIQKDGKTVDFKAGNVYKLDVKFKEEHIMHEDQLCVEIEVKIAAWKVNTVTPVFGN